MFLPHPIRKYMGFSSHSPFLRDGMNSPPVLIGKVGTYLTHLGIGRKGVLRTARRMQIEIKIPSSCNSLYLESICSIC